MMNKINLIKQCLVLFLSLTSFSLNAQIQVSGVVIDEKGETLIGVTVVDDKNTQNATMTDIEGKFKISVKSEDSKLSFTYLGFKKVEQKIPSNRSMKVVMLEDNKFLDEVVVIGYQDVKRKDLTGSVGSANISDMLKAQVPNFDQALAGRIAGVSVNSSSGMVGSSMNIVIRGNSSVTQDNSPMFIIDGFPVEDPNIGATINPNDIESIDVLKDASAAAIYGSRGANGVIIITTKKGKEGSVQVNYDFNYGVQRVSNKVKLMDAYNFVKLQEDMFTESEMSKEGYGYYPLYDGKQYTLEDYKNVDQYNWQDMIFKSAGQQSHNVSLTGGSPQLRFNASLGYYDQDGVILKSNYQKIQGRAGVRFRKSKLNANINTSYTRSTTTGNNPSENTSASGMNNLFFNVWGYRPVTEPGTPLSSLLNNLLDESINPTNDYRFNPYMNLINEHKKYFLNYLQFDGFAEYEFIKGVKLKVSGGYTSDTRKWETFNNSKTRYGQPGSINGVNATLATSERITWLNENTLSYQNVINNLHSISAFVGVTLQESKYTYNSSSTKNIPNESLGMAGMGQGTPNQIISEQSDWGILSYLGRVNYNYQSKYYLTGSFRADGSSKFDKDNRWGYFPSASIAWNVMEESFMAPLKPISNMAKLRMSLGTIGNNRIGEYARFAQLGMYSAATGNYTTSNGIPHSLYPINGSLSSKGTIPISLANKDLKWETTTQTNIGIDLSFFNDRVSFTTDWYNKNTSDLLLYTNLPLSSGYAGAMKNIGKINNRGWEFTLNTINVQTKDFKWSTNFNISFNRNKVISLTNNENSMLSIASFDQTFNSMPSYIAKVGYPIGMMYGYLFEGTYKYEDFDNIAGEYVLKQNIPYYSSENKTQPGYPRYKDINNDGVIDDNDRTIIGKGDPKHTGGFTNNFEYKGFDMSIFFQWSYGNDILNANRLMFETGFNLRKNLNQFASFADRWTPDNPTSNMPRVSTSSSNLLFSSRVIEDGSFLRLKTISLGYTIPSKHLKKLHLSSARLYMSVQNLITFTNYSGYDPEVSIRNSAITPGLDFSAYPRAKAFNFGLNLSF